MTQVDQYDRNTVHTAADYAAQAAASLDARDPNLQQDTPRLHVVQPETIASNVETGSHSSAEDLRHRVYPMPEGVVSVVESMPEVTPPNAQRSEAAIVKDMFPLGAAVDDIRMDEMQRYLNAA